MKSYNNINIFYHQTLACLLTCQWRYKYIVYLKNRWGGAYWQSSGLTVIPTISWGDERSFEFCFEGVEKGSTVAVCTYYRENCEEEFMLGYNKMLEIIKPSAIICYDEPFDKMTGNIKSFLPTTYEWTKALSWQDYSKFHFDKKNRNVINYQANN